MESETPEDKEKQGEERLYEPIRSELESILAHYVSREKPHTLMSAPAPRVFPEKDVHLEITAFAKSGFSGTLERELDDDALYILKVEGIKPDITGFMRRKGDSVEIITIEVKDETLKVLHFPQARFYQDIFSATYGLLISSKQIPERITRFALKRPDIRGKLILIQYLEPLHAFRIHPAFEPHVLDPFKIFTKPI